MRDHDTQCDPSVHENAKQADRFRVWFSDRHEPEDLPPFCLVCWAYGGTITRHRARPVASLAS